MAILDTIFELFKNFNLFKITKGQNDFLSFFFLTLRLVMIFSHNRPVPEFVCVFLFI